MKTCIVVFLMMWTAYTASAHAIWVETAYKGHLNKYQEVRIYYGEYPDGKPEAVNGRFKEVENFTVWLIAPDGKRTQLDVFPKENFYFTGFTPSANGNYAILVINTKRDVVDWTKYDLGILKPNYYAITNVSVNTKDTFNPADKVTDLNIITAVKPAKRKKPVEFTVFYRGIPAANKKIIVMAPNGWTKELSINDEGKAEFTPQWKGVYVAEVVYTEKEKGNYEGAAFDSIRERCTYTFQVK